MHHSSDAVSAERDDQHTYGYKTSSPASASPPSGNVPPTPAVPPGPWTHDTAEEAGPPILHEASSPLSSQRIRAGSSAAVHVNVPSSLSNAYVPSAHCRACLARPPSGTHQTHQSSVMASPCAKQR